MSQFANEHPLILLAAIYLVGLWTVEIIRAVRNRSQP